MTGSSSYTILLILYCPKIAHTIFFILLLFFIFSIKKYPEYKLYIIRSQIIIKEMFKFCRPESGERSVLALSLHALLCRKKLEARRT